MSKCQGWYSTQSLYNRKVVWSGQGWQCFTDHGMSTHRRVRRAVDTRRYTWKWFGGRTASRWAGVSGRYTKTQLHRSVRHAGRLYGRLALAQGGTEDCIPRRTADRGLARWRSECGDKGW